MSNLAILSKDSLPDDAQIVHANGFLLVSNVGALPVGKDNIEDVIENFVIFKVRKDKEFYVKMWRHSNENNIYIHFPSGTKFLCYGQNQCQRLFEQGLVIKINNL